MQVADKVWKVMWVWEKKMHEGRVPEKKKERYFEFFYVFSWDIYVVDSPALVMAPKI